MPERGQPESVLDGAQQCVVVEPLRRVRAGPDERPECEGRDLVSVRLVVLVEDDEDDAVAKRAAPEKGLEKTVQPCVPGRHRTVVHVVAEIGHDEREIGESVPGKVACEVGERDDPAEPVRALQDVAKVKEGLCLFA